jgi:hypothetical protein
MLTAMRYLMVLSLAVWVGGIIFFAFTVAPVAFTVLPGSQAGLVVGPSLSRLHFAGIIAGVVFLGAAAAAARQVTGSAQWGSRRTWLIVAMLAMTLVSQFAITPRIRDVRRRILDQTGTFDQGSERRAFDRLHRLSVLLESGVLILGLIAIYPTVKFPS